MIRKPGLTRKMLAGVAFDYVPTENETVDGPDTGKNLTVRLNNAQELENLTYLLPDESVARFEQRVFIRCQNQISNLMVSAKPGVIVDNWVVNLAPGDCVVFYRADSGIWSKVS